MSGKLTTTAIVGALLLGSGSAMADTAPASNVQALEAKMQRMEAELAQLRSQQTENWMTERRAEEVKSLVHEVLSDADTRASLLQEGALAGIDDKGKIFLKSADGSFKLNLSGHLQVRYIWNSRDSDGGAVDSDVAGFQIRRAKFKGKGHIGDPKISYGFAIAGDRDDPATTFEDYYLGYDFGNGFGLKAGRFKQPFARVNMTSSSRQLTVERSLANETFNVDRSEGVQVDYEADMFRVAASFNDGIDGDYSDFDENLVDYAITARGEFLIAGDWKQFKDFTAWSGEDFGAMVGAAIHFQDGESDSAVEDASLLLATVDGSVETAGLGVFGAFYYSSEDDGTATYNEYGFEVSGSYNINDEFEPFIRYELIALDDDRGAVDDNINIVTLGMNWYQKKHAAKFTVDLVWVLNHIEDYSGTFGNGVDPSTGLGLLDDSGDKDGQVALRAQYQLTF